MERWGTVSENEGFLKQPGIYIPCTLFVYQAMCRRKYKRKQIAWLLSTAALQRYIHTAPPEVKERAYQTLVRRMKFSPHSAKGIAIRKWVERRAASKELYKMSVSSSINELNW